MLVFVTSCHEELGQPPFAVPVAEAVPNMTIAEFKAKHWQNSDNYVDTVTEDEVIHGWVTANDISNNIYKTVYISDGSAGISLSINQSNLYEKFRVGQEIVLPMKGHYVGKATGQMYIAAPYNFTSGDRVTLECLNMSSNEMDSLVQFNQWPDLSKVDTIDLQISDFQGKYDAETMLKYQGLLVRFRDVEFVDADGYTAFAPGSSSENREIKDDQGNTLVLRCSNSSDFATDNLPSGRCDVVGALGYYTVGTPTWQLYLRTRSDIVSEGKKGTKSLPYSVADAIELQSTGAKGWVEGYIVGAAGPEVTTVTSNADIEWMAPTTLDNTIVITDDPDCKDYTKCVIVPLPVGSSFRSAANLKSNPIAYKGHVMVKGTLAPYMDMTGITGNTGSREEYVLDVAYTQLKEEFTSGIPYEWTNLNVSGTNKWVKATFNSEVYASATGYKGSNPPYEIWLITPKLDIKNAKSKVFNFDSQVNNYGNIRLEVYLLDSNDPRTATVKVKLNPKLPNKPTSSPYSGWVNSGDLDLSDWGDGVYYVGFYYYAPEDPSNSYTTWCIDNVTFGMGDPAPADNRADFESMGDKLGEWGTFTSKKGWTATNCMLLRGASYDNNPEFQFIGLIPGYTKTYAVAPTLNGNTTSVGKIVSPVLEGGMTKLRFNYGYAFSGKNIAFRVDVKQNGNVIKSWDVTQSGVSKYTVYDFEEVCPVSGKFTIEFTNLSPSGAASEKDRLSIWNVEWDQ